MNALQDLDNDDLIERYLTGTLEREVDSKVIELLMLESKIRKGLPEEAIRDNLSKIVEMFRVEKALNHLPAFKTLVSPRRLIQNQQNIYLQPYITKRLA